ncbi:MAG TPA: M50 family metallopeptidase [Caulobacteraceae bacterium]|nr:M50 family metallopeptidase [Caulobacteraceae bacterium]
MLAFLQSAAIYIVPFLLVLTLIVTVHELGHFLVARALGTKVDSFSIGFGRAIVRFQDKSGVDWKLGWIPLGGYVKFAGDDNAASVPDREAVEAFRREVVANEGEGAASKYFHLKPVWQRALIVAAGPVMNFVLAIAIFTVLFAAIGEQTVAARVQSVAEGPAKAAGFLPGDVIVGANGRPTPDVGDVRRVIALNADTPVKFQVKRGDQLIVLTATPVRGVVQDEIAGAQKIGVLRVSLGPSSQADLAFKRHSVPEAMGRAVQQTWNVLETTVTYLGRVITGRESGDQLGGPLRIAKTSGAVAEQATKIEGGWELKALNLAIQLLSLAALLSIGIGFLNLLPVPVLDGGHLLFYAYEAVARQPLGAEIQAVGYRVGLALLLGLMLFVTWNDLQQLRVFQILGGLFS